MVVAADCANRSYRTGNCRSPHAGRNIIDQGTKTAHLVRRQLEVLTPGTTRCASRADIRRDRQERCSHGLTSWSDQRHKQNRRKEVSKIPPLFHRARRLAVGNDEFVRFVTLSRALVALKTRQMCTRLTIERRRGVK